ncbi:MAG: hypothetical protein GTO53_01215 [Planctomycetales bacterium]|nr:hypothetical protein [Planctomycetales bacterium]NIM07795.1 hypothetical protein [Planctomycetales bacterium]NIN07286.1 hypothetical protein [Planctomycetales bacterium]NIN76381.1 hypothetical protein [Planctomycetales bacterium]NIO33586.1 hypothetical protein [Planctomycetales bacterium]
MDRKRIFKAWKCCLLRVLLFASLSLPGAAAFAQEEKAEAGGKSYILAYVLVGFVVALAMMVVCRGTSRRDKPKMVEADLQRKLDQMQTGKG